MTDLLNLLQTLVVQATVADTDFDECGVSDLMNVLLFTGRDVLNPN